MLNPEPGVVTSDPGFFASYVQVDVAGDAPTHAATVVSPVNEQSVQLHVAVAVKVQVHADDYALPYVFENLSGCSGEVRAPQLRHLSRP